MKTKVLILLFSFYAFNSTAQVNSFSLNEAVDYALKNNPSSVNASNDLKIAKAKKWETIATGLPQISAFIDYNNNIKQKVSLVPAEFFGGNPGEFAEISFGTKQTFEGTATLKQLLFNGSYTVALSSVKLYLEIASNAKIKTDLEVKRNVISAYGNVLISQERVKLLNQNLENITANLNEVQKIYENGLTELENVEQLTITFSTLKNSLNYANKFVQTSKNILKLVIGLPINEEISLKDNLTQLTLKKITYEETNSTNTVSQNIDYIIASKNISSQKVLLKLEQSKALPTLSAFIKRGYNGNSNSFNFFKSNQKWYGSSIAGVTMSIPIFSSFKRSAKTQQAKIELEKAKVGLTHIEQKLLIEIGQAKSDYQFAIENYYNSNQNLVLAEKIERKNQIKFYEGLASSFDLRQAQNQLYSIQNELLQSMLEVINKKTNLEIILNEN
jgi:outer membrane protein TolC|tara:strand:- start:481 stop:1812 length:1332 start_codon:yes stop_codon:yes gene_type:complete